MERTEKAPIPTPCSKNPESTLSLIEDASDIKQVRTDTTLDLSQKTRKRYTMYLSIRVTVCEDTHMLPTLISAALICVIYQRSPDSGTDALSR